MKSLLTDTANSRPMLAPSNQFRDCLRSSTSAGPARQSAGQRERLAQAGYPRFVFRLASSQRTWDYTDATPRRHD